MIDGLSPEKELAKFGITKPQISKLVDRGNTVRLTHLLKIIDPGLILAKHVFRGLRRPLWYGDDSDGERSKLVYSWKPTKDYDWQHARRFDGAAGVIERPAPADQVFVVITTPNQLRAEFPDVDYWIENTWTWAEEDKELAFAPTGWSNRYDEKVVSYDN